MNSWQNRRVFLKNAATAGALASLGDLGFLWRLPRVSSAEAVLKPDTVQFLPEIEPLVRLLEDTSRDRLLEEVGSRIRHGLSYREIVTALLLAGVRNIQPRPVGFKFHAVLVVNSAHLASLSSPDSDRWLPIFWALDQFKNSQAQDVRERDWTMSPVSESSVPPADKAREAFVTAMENWDVPAADAAVAGLARCAGAHEVFEVLARLGARDFRDLGHKAIYVANAWRTLQMIGWQHAEPVLRSLAYALLEHEGANPATRDADPDRSGRRNLKLAASIRPDWQAGTPNSEATRRLLEVFRSSSEEDAARHVIETLNRGISPKSIWDAIFQSAGEMLMRQPGIATLHSVTCANALHFAYLTSGRDETRRFLLLQSSSFIPAFRSRIKGGSEVRIDQLEPWPTQPNGPGAIDEIFAEISRDRMAAARKTLTYLTGHPQPNEFIIQAARRLVFLKGTDSHDYKFSSAVFEDFHFVSQPWRTRYLAASVHWLRGSAAPENNLTKRTRAALVG